MSCNKGMDSHKVVYEIRNPHNLSNKQLSQKDAYDLSVSPTTIVGGKHRLERWKNSPPQKRQRQPVVSSARLDRSVTFLQEIASSQNMTPTSQLGIRIPHMTQRQRWFRSNKNILSLEGISPINQKEEDPGRASLRYRRYRSSCQK